MNNFDNFKALLDHPKASGFVMNKDREVVRIDNDSVTKILDNDLCPFWFIRSDSFPNWLESRDADFSRVNARLLRKYLYNTTSEFERLKHNHAIQITDNYWFKFDGESIEYKDLIPSKDLYEDTVLYGKTPNNPSKTPNYEITTLGSYDKCWKKDSDGWWLYKRGSNDKIITEYFCYLVNKTLGFRTAEYKVVSDELIKSKMFLKPNEVFEHMEGLVGSVDLSTYNYKLIKSLEDSFNVPLTKDYLNILYFDILVNNYDRHTQNYGLIRDSNTGNVLLLGPNFDYNESRLKQHDEYLDDSLLNVLKEFNVDFRIPLLTETQLASIVNKCSKLGFNFDFYNTMKNLLINYKRINTKILEVSS